MATQYTAGLAQGQVLTAAIMNQLGAAWETWTPNFRPETGAFTSSVTTYARYGRIQNLIFGQALFQITNFGTGNGAVIFTLPVTGKSADGTIGSAREGALSGAQANVFMSAGIGASNAAIRFYNNGNCANGNYLYPIFFMYEAA